MENNSIIERIKVLNNELEELKDNNYEMKKALISITLCGASTFVCSLNCALLHDMTRSNAISLATSVVSIVSLLLSTSCFALDGVLIKKIIDSKIEEKRIIEELDILNDYIIKK